MKQINKTPEITAALRQSVGPDVNLDNLAVYEAIALNNRPIRKNHPLYKGAVADRSLLLEMAAALSIESRPVQIQHDIDGLPSGRAFLGRVRDSGSESELRVLFFVDKSEDKILSKLDSGTIDQVSVSVIPKKMLNSISGFDYLGPEAKPENIWTGADNDGNTIGKNGVHAKMVGLDKWFELSLVGQGGAENARIVSHDESYFGSSYQKLAASGVDPSIFVLEASTENDTMDLSGLSDKLIELSGKNATLTSEMAVLTSQNSTLTNEVADLKNQLAEASKPTATLTADLADKTTEATELKADNDKAIEGLQVVAKALLAASGKVDAEVPKTIAELTALIDESKDKIVAAFKAGGVSSDTTEGVDREEAPTTIALNAFRRRK